MRSSWSVAHVNAEQEIKLCAIYCGSKEELLSNPQKNTTQQRTYQPSLEDKGIYQQDRHVAPLLLSEHTMRCIPEH